MDDKLIKAIELAACERWSEFNTERSYRVLCQKPVLQIEPTTGLVGVRVRITGEPVAELPGVHLGYDARPDVLAIWLDND